MEHYTLGIDDAGRGPLIGPMILAGVLLTDKQEKILKKHNVKDSKQLAHPTRIDLSGLIRKNVVKHAITKSSPNEIDDALTSGTNLNTLEAQKTAEIINALNEKDFYNKKIKVIVDCPSTNTRAWRSTLLKYISYAENLIITCEHKADANYTSVSAASILAKVEREDEIEKIREHYKKYGDVGSGYPSDPITKEFLKKNGAKLKNEGIFRKTWSTWKSIFPEKLQTTLEEF